MIKINLPYYPENYATTVVFLKIEKLDEQGFGVVTHVTDNLDFYLMTARKKKLLR